MTSRSRLRSAIWLAVAALSLPAAAQVGGDYELERVTVSGGGDSSGGGLALSAASGQPEPAATTGGSYELNSGFYAPARSDRIFTDSFE